MENISVLITVLFIVLVVVRRKSREQNENVSKAKARQEAFRSQKGTGASRGNAQLAGGKRNNPQSGSIQHNNSQFDNLQRSGSWLPSAKSSLSSIAKSGVHPDMPVRVKGGLKSDANAKVSASLHDDRNNDWLANQMREERNSLFRLREMFGFQLQGRGITEAEMLKEFHMDHCSADGIDTAAGK